jgi:hypothetical protein
MKWLSHLRTVQHHRFLVLRHCWRVGLYWQGLTHDLSKFSPVEFSAGAKYYQGNRSPNEIERREKGYSAAWLHHKGRNKHHLEYWIDYAADGSGMCGMKMPIQYVIEMFCDRVAASKTYRGAAYRDSDPYDYYAHSVDHYIIHPPPHWNPCCVFCATRARKGRLRLRESCLKRDIEQKGISRPADSFL